MHCQTFVPAPVRSSLLESLADHHLPTLPLLLPSGHVVAHQEIGHTLTEQAVLKRMSREIQNPFIVHLHHSFHDKDNL